MNGVMKIAPEILKIVIGKGALFVREKVDGIMIEHIKVFNLTGITAGFSNRLHWPAG